jgi:hypothetical protein
MRGGPSRSCRSSDELLRLSKDLDSSAGSGDQSSIDRSMSIPNAIDAALHAAKRPFDSKAFRVSHSGRSRYAYRRVTAEMSRCPSAAAAGSPRRSKSHSIASFGGPLVHEERRVRQWRSYRFSFS